MNRSDFSVQVGTGSKLLLACTVHVLIVAAELHHVQGQQTCLPHM